jgi:ABC-2 type transport system ATP-binding protein
VNSVDDLWALWAAQDDQRVCHQREIGYQGLMTDLGPIKVSGLSYSYGRKVALEDVSIAVRPGRFTALLGANGAGKTTLVSLLCGLLASQRGTIEILGFDAARNLRAALRETGVVFQQQTLDLDLTVQQNMTYFAALRGLSGGRATERIQACVSRMGLDGREGEKVRRLNGGHRRRLEIARALLHQPSFLILDEPTVGLDVEARAALVDHVHALCRQEGVALLWATHLVDEVWLDDDLIVLDAGRVRAAGPVSEVLAVQGCPDVLSAFRKIAGISGTNASVEAEA